MSISRAKLKEHCCKISGGILDSVFLSETIYDPITLHICIMQVRKYLQTKTRHFKMSFKSPSNREDLIFTL